jgi:hypothetical protein
MNLQKEALVKAAEDWLTALEVLVVAKNASPEMTETEQEAADLAEVRLVIAIKARRLDRVNLLKPKLLPVCDSGR